MIDYEKTLMDIVRPMVDEPEKFRFSKWTV